MRMVRAGYVHALEGIGTGGPSIGGAVGSGSSAGTRGAGSGAAGPQRPNDCGIPSRASLSSVTATDVGATDAGSATMCSKREGVAARVPIVVVAAVIPVGRVETGTPTLGSCSRYQR